MTAQCVAPRSLPDVVAGLDPATHLLRKSLYEDGWMRGSSPTANERRRTLPKTLGSKRHQALIALLIERREAAGMTQTQLADRLGEYQSFVARLESGQRRVDVVEFLELAEVLGFDAGKVLAAVRKVG